MNQKAALRLQERMNELSTEEYSELQRYSNPEIMNPYHECFDTFAIMRQGVKVVYSKKRRRAIWWYEHGFDIKVLVCVVVFVLGLIWWMV